MTEITLEQLCREQGQPFIRLNSGNPTRELTLRSLTGDGLVPFRETAMSCGRVNATIFGKSYISDQQGRAVFLGQSHRDCTPGDLTTYLEERGPAVLGVEKIEEECCFLGGFSGNDRFFGHFIFEFLYRLAAFDTCGLLERLPVVVFEGVPDRWLSFIERYGVPRKRIRRVPQYPYRTHATFTRAWITPCPNRRQADGYAYSFWDDGIHQLRKAMTRGLSGPKRVFIGRADAKHRQLVNEAEVLAALAPLGFVPARFTGRASEQIAAVASAEIIVCVGGSGSVMTHFAPRDCQIIEILAPHLVGALGSLGVAAVLGQHFTRIEAPVVDDRENIRVEVKAVLACVEMAMRYRAR